VWLQQLLSLSEALPLHRNTTSASWALVRKNTKEDGDNLSFTYFAMFDLTTLRGQAYAGELEALYLGKGGVALPQMRWGLWAQGLGASKQGNALRSIWRWPVLRLPHQTPQAQRQHTTGG
jgi:hypothetical protein